MKGRLRQQLDRFSVRDDALGRAARLIDAQVALWRFCARRLSHYNVFAMSAALSFRTIFALVPALVLALLAANTFGVLEDRKRSLRDLLEATGFAQIAVSVDEHGSADAGGGPSMASRPAEPRMIGSPAVDPHSAAPPEVEPRSAVSLADEIEKIVGNVEGKLTLRRIGPVGGALLIWTALGLLSTIEISLNRIFGAPRSRSMVRRVVRYWSVATLGPVALTLTIYFGQRAIEICAPLPALGWAVGGLSRLMPVLVGVLMISFVYVLFPNTTVRIRNAVGGAAAAVLIWIGAKWGFGLYVERFVSNGNLYGVLGVIPLFLMWLNLSWLVFLFGAELAHTSANLRRMQSAELAERIVLTPSDALAVALAVSRSFAAGKGAVPLDAIAGQLTLPDISIRWLLDRLADRGVIAAVRDGGETAYVMGRPPSAVHVRELFEMFGVDGQYTSAADQLPELARAIAGVEDRVRASVADLTLADVG